MHLKNCGLGLLIFSILTSAPAAPSADKIQITEEILQQCYKAHPFLLENLLLLSEEFQDPQKARARNVIIEAEFKKNPESIRTCVESVIQFAKDQKDAKNLKYVLTRMKEITKVVHSKSGKVARPRAAR